MAKESLQKLLSLTLFIWGFVFLYASEPQPTASVYVAPGTIITGLEYVHLSNTPAAAAPVVTRAKAIIYISPNTVFTAPDEMLRQAVVIYTHQIKPSKARLIAKSESKKSVKASEALVCEQKILSPFRSLPSQNPQQFISCGAGLITFFVTQMSTNAIVIAAISFDFLPSVLQHCQPSCSEVAFLSLSNTLQAHPSRPPPFC